MCRSRRRRIRHIRCGNSQHASELSKAAGTAEIPHQLRSECAEALLEVAHIAGLLAGELGLDATIAKRAGLLHDIGKSVDHEVEGTHIQIGVELAKNTAKAPPLSLHQPRTTTMWSRRPWKPYWYRRPMPSGARPGARRDSAIILNALRNSKRSQIRSEWKNASPFRRAEIRIIIKSRTWFPRREP